MTRTIRREGRGLSLPMEAQTAIALSSVAIVLIVRPFLRLCPEIPKIPKNSINIDKFTGLFDKFMKKNRRYVRCKAFKYNELFINMSARRSDKASIIFFAFRICPQIR
ncbi:MAG: hypothetical protein OXL41_10110 [Nitrospinae bacterium]|nr:hypothetical protein [Nitrospinota bacterium]